ncbi:MAG: phosphoribosylanthranilate isomerase [Spirochaetaceae bacterium]|jgi:phosphoribosylanthranilate isomerase|nr:phosphoribosylanthranilate isomerase [Spirochaetaceae bacterium]
MKIKICGLFREQDIEYVNEALPDYIGFVFAPGKRQVSPARAETLRKSLTQGIIPVGVFVNAPIEAIAALYRNGIISIAQLHGGEDSAYIAELKALLSTQLSEACAAKQDAGRREPIRIIKTIQSSSLEALKGNTAADVTAGADYCLIDSGAGSGQAFDWQVLKPGSVQRERIEALGKPWFLAGGICQNNIEKALALNPFGVDISSGAETDGIKDREKIMQLVRTVRMTNTENGKGNTL